MFSLRTERQELTQVRKMVKLWLQNKFYLKEVAGCGFLKNVMEQASLVFEAFGVVDPLVPPLFVSLLTEQYTLSELYQQPQVLCVSLAPFAVTPFTE
jgi:hypothetical protein